MEIFQLLVLAAVKNLSDRPQSYSCRRIELYGEGARALDHGTLSNPCSAKSPASLPGFFHHLSDQAHHHRLASFLSNFACFLASLASRFASFLALRRAGQPQ